VLQVGEATADSVERIDDDAPGFQRLEKRREVSIDDLTLAGEDWVRGQDLGLTSQRFTFRSRRSHLAACRRHLQQPRLWRRRREIDAPPDQQLAGGDACAWLLPEAPL
jgi:hypothetical protein